MNPQIPDWKCGKTPKGESGPSLLLPASGWSAHAFTLIEVLLAVSIFAIVLVAIHSVFYGALRLRNKTTEALEQALPLQHTLTIIKRDLANIVLPGGTLFGELQTAQTINSSTNSLSLLSPVQDAVPGQSSPAFFTATGILQDSFPWGEVERVSYFLAPPTNNTPGKDLIRSVTRNLLPVLQEEVENQWLMSGLDSMLFYFYDGIQWREDWDSTVEVGKLPRGIKVELQLAQDETERVRRAPIELVIPVMLQAGTNSAAQSSGGAL